MSDKEPGSAAKTEPETLEKAAGYVMVTSIAQIAVAIARSKVTATVLGPAGMGLASEILQMAQNAVVPITLIAGPSFVSTAARARGRGETPRRAYDTAASFVILMTLPAVALGAGLAVALLGPEDRLRNAGLAAVATLGLAIAAGASLPTSVLVAWGRVGRASWYTIGNALVSGAAVVACTLAFGMPGQFLGLLVANVVLLLVALPWYRRELPDLDLRPSLELDRGTLGETASTSATSTVAAMTAQLMLTVVRRVLTEAHGAAATGHFQAAWQISGAYFGIVLKGLTNAVFPRYAAARDHAELAVEVAAAADWVLRRAPPVILLGIALRWPIIRVLYTSEFDDSAIALGMMMAGDLAKGMTWVYAGPLLARGRLRAFIVTEVCGNLLIATAAIGFAPWLGPAGAGLAILIGQALVCPITAITLRVSCEVPVDTRRLALTGAFTGASAGLVLLTDAIPATQLLVLGVGAAWAVAAGWHKGPMAKLKGLAARLRPR